VLKHEHILHLRKYVWDITALSIILLIISSAIVFTIVTSEITFQNTRDVFLKIFTPLILTVIFHELVHVITAVKLGYKVKVGYGRIKFNPVFYVKVVGGIKKKHYIAITLSPLITLSSTSIVLASIIPNVLIKEILSILFIMNTAGSSGDVLLALSASKIPGEALIEDYGTMITSDKLIPRPYSEKISLLIRILTLLIIVATIILFKIKIVIVK